MLRILMTASVLVGILTGPASAQPVWEQVVGSAPGLLNGFGDPENHGILSMVVFNGHLYVGTSNEVTGAEVWRTNDGTTWSQVNANGFGVASNQSAPSMMTFGGFLYVGTHNDSLGCQLWRSSNGTLWTDVALHGFGNPLNTSAQSMAVFASSLYVGTRNDTGGAEMWRSNNGTTWSSAATAGLGDPVNEEVSSIAVFGGYLFVGTDNPNGPQVLRSNNGSSWDEVTPADWSFDPGYLLVARPLVVFENSLFVGYGTWEDFVGGGLYLTDNGVDWTSAYGWGDQQRPTSAVVFDGSLFVGVSGNSVIGTGAEMWRTYQGSWVQTNNDGFGDSGNYSVSSLAVLDDHLYAGTYNSQAGCEVWRLGKEPPLFADGFESGNTSAWSNTTF